MENSKLNLDNIVDEINKLTEKSKQAVYWMLGHIDLLYRLCEGDRLTKEQVDIYIKRALKNEDYIMLIMVLYKQEKDRINS